jgi:hypothetical protein
MLAKKEGPDRQQFHKQASQQQPHPNTGPNQTHAATSSLRQRTHWTAGSEARAGKKQHVARGVVIAIVIVVFVVAVAVAVAVRIGVGICICICMDIRITVVITSDAVPDPRAVWVVAVAIAIAIAALVAKPASSCKHARAAPTIVVGIVVITSSDSHDGQR